MPPPSSADDNPSPSEVRGAVDRQSEFPPENLNVMPCQKDRKHWVEVRMIDGARKPVPGLKCRLRVSDGSLRNGTLDDKGVCRFDDLPAGSAYVCFPELDEEAWSKV